MNVIAITYIQTFRRLDRVLHYLAKYPKTIYVPKLFAYFQHFWRIKTLLRFCDYTHILKETRKLGEKQIWEIPLFALTIYMQTVIAEKDVDLNQPLEKITRY